MPNQIRIEGNLGKDAEARFTPTGRAVLGFSIAADQQSRKNEQGEWEQTGPTLWLDCQFWTDNAEQLAQTMPKGAKVIVFGHVKCETWQDKQTGEQRFKNKVAVDAVKVLPPRNQGGFQQQGQQGGYAQQPAAQQDTFAAGFDSADAPF